MTVLRLLAFVAFVVSAVFIGLSVLPVVAALLIPAGLAAFMLTDTSIDKAI